MPGYTHRKKDQQTRIVNVRLRHRVRGEFGKDTVSCDARRRSRLLTSDAEANTARTRARLRSSFVVRLLPVYLVNLYGILRT